MKLLIPVLLSLATCASSNELPAGISSRPYTVTPPAETSTPAPEIRYLKPSYYENGKPVYVNPKEKHIDCNEEINRKLRDCRYNQF